jgi:hypothetical protein
MTLASSYRLRAGFYEGEGDIVLAESDYDRAVELDDFWLSLFAKFCRRNDLSSKYLTCLNRLVQLKPEKYLGCRAQFFESRSCMGEALRDYDEWVKCSRVIGWSLGACPIIQN